MERYNNLDNLPLADLKKEDLNKLKNLEHELTQKYNNDIFVMALEENESDQENKDNQNRVGGR
ncbi:hypothetical protein [Natranaerobius thermophilus]|uniref:Uncharacterized protein n=1 Tax=Natranaerobius thermophilus (strain ATCC BAA-1301 / DSM 18059 / JW/NM-WN-LF) TaxID=457570 RepID=B2A6T9_NATTJ|nr:hypothetical protein [Natranaerobius thermophilus]ACB84220.1 hypothetical protein Nther_0625 [Natranaerobius thermophilus JW/NM-WN-LF]